MRIGRYLTKLNHTIRQFLSTTPSLNPMWNRRQLALVALFVVAGFLLAWLTMWPQLGRVFSPDSYSYFLLGQNLFDGHGFTTFAIRDLHDDPAWPLPSRSFPPLFPLLTGFVDFITDAGIHSGVIVNLITLLGTLVIVCFLCRTLTPRYWLLLALTFIVFVASDAFYRGELGQARAIPLTLFWYIIFLTTFIKSLDRDNRPYVFESIAGICLGLMILTRFDQLLFSLAALVIAIFCYRQFGFSKRQVLLKMSCLVGFFFLTYLPWGVRCLAVFGTPFAANNTLTALSIFNGHAPICFWSPENFPKTIFDDPGLWLTFRLRYATRNWNAIVEVTHSLIYIVPIFTAIVWRRMPRPHKVIVLLGLAYGIIHYLSVSLTPFPDRRYWAQLHFTLLLIFGLSLTSILDSSRPRRIGSFIVGSVVFICCWLPLGNQRGPGLGTRLFSGKLIPHNVTNIARRYQEKQAYYASVTDTEGAIFSPARNGEVFAYYTGERSVIFPRNVRRGLLTNPDFYAWLSKWKIDYIQVDKRYFKRFSTLTRKEFIVAQRPTDLLLDARKILAAHNERTTSRQHATKPPPKKESTK